ncbi:hypothetical protein [Mycolicibacterium monacense]|uniref:PPE family protein n=1 Tax=Mycobacterium sp. (strain JLS) TaxID=164757 RepID=A0A5Q5CMU1_MYCSJ|nr:hypothetical protein [Mycolicibacterium monacense]ORB21790.1 hypothetical protein BST34_08580 [Mycolicibacterium monacense DSM 44395]QHP89445.1 hypothetical protein EWR22_25275 [Mycolicibacterium monacense DSM 44395]
MGIMPDTSPYGSQTVTGPGWPNVDEETLAAAAASYEALAAKLSGSVVPQQQGQLMKLSDAWEGGGAVAAAGEASTIIGGHEANAAHAAAIAAKLREMEVAVVRTKTMVNTMAQETQHECEAIQALPFSNTQQLVQARVKMGLSQNIAQVTASSTELANSFGVPPSIPTPGVPPTVPGQQAAQGAAKEAGQAGGQGSQQGMQQMMQMASMAGQLPQQIGQMVSQVPQQMMQPLQQLSQPLQQLTSMFGQGGKADSLGAAGLPFSSFSNHPLAGGSGAGGGGGMMRAASLPGSGGVSAQTPLMAGLVGTNAVSVAPAEPVVAGSAAVGGVAPVAAGAMGGMGGMGAPMGMMGGRGSGGGGGTRAGLAAPEPLEYDLDEDVDDEW